MGFYILLAECDEEITTRDRVTGKEEILYFDSYDAAEKHALTIEKMQESEFYIMQD
jgi:hypothetical protein